MIYKGRPLSDDALMSNIINTEEGEHLLSTKIQIFPRPPIKPLNQEEEQRRNERDIKETRENVENLMSLTGFSREACFVAVIENQGDVSAAAANLYSRQDSVVNEKKEALMAEGMAEDEVDQIIDDKAVEEVFKEVEQEMAEKVEEMKSTTKTTKEGFVINPSELFKSVMEPKPETEPELELKEPVPEPEPEPEPEVKEPEPEPEPKVKESPKIEPKPASLLENLLADADADQDKSPRPLPTPLPPKPTPKLPEQLNLSASPLPSPRDLSREVSEEPIKTSKQATVENIFQSTRLHRIPGKDFTMPDLKMFDVPEGLGKNVKDVKDLEAIKTNKERIRGRVETEMRLESLAMSDITTSANKPTFHIRYRAKTRALRRIKCYRGWINDEVKMASLVSELKLWAKISSVSHNRRASNTLNDKGVAAHRKSVVKERKSSQHNAGTPKHQKHAQISPSGHRRSVVPSPKDGDGASANPTYETPTKTKKHTTISSSPQHQRGKSTHTPTSTHGRKHSTTPKHNNKHGDYDGGHKKNMFGQSGMRHKFVPKDHNFCVPVIGYSATFDCFQSVEGPHEKGSELGIVVDYCDGNLMRTQIEGIGRLKEYDVLRWAMQVCEAIKYMHSLNICHMGIRSDVVQLTGSDTVGKLDAVVVDFGTARECQGGVKGECECDINHIPNDNYTAPELHVQFITSSGGPTLIHPSKLDVWGLGCLLFELVTKSLIEDGEPLRDMESTAMAKVPSRFGDIVKHLLRRSLKQDPRKRAEIDEIEDVLVQRLDILDAQNKEFVKSKLPPEDELPNVSNKDLLALAKKSRKGGATGGKKGGKGKATMVSAEMDELASILDGDESVSTVESSKIKEKLLLKIEEAKRLATEQGWTRTKERVNETLRRRWWNSLTDHERFIVTHKKITRRENIVKACRRKLSKKAALCGWWTTKFVTVFVGHILKKLEAAGCLDKMKGGSFLVGGGVRVIEEKKVAEFSDDESSVASSVFTAKSLESASVASSKVGTAKVSMTSLEQGRLDHLINFELAIPVYIPFRKLLEVKNGVYFPVPEEDPNVIEADRRKQELALKMQAGLLLKDGSESPEQLTKRNALQAKMHWKGAGNKVKMAIALAMEVRHVDQGEDRVEVEDLDEETKVKMSEEEAEALKKAREVKAHMLGSSYAEAMVEAMDFHGLNGKKWASWMFAADEEAEVIMERMREQSLLTEVSEQILIKQNTIAKQLPKNEEVDSMFERAIRTAEMPRIPGWDDESKHHLLTRMQSVAQLKESAVGEDGLMIFKKLEMASMKTVLGFCLQRSYAKLHEIVWEGRFNAAATIQARVRGGIVRRIMAKVLEESAKRSKEILNAERRRRVQQREREIIQKCMKSLIIEVSDCTSNSMVVKLPDILVDLGRSKKHGFKIDSRIRKGVNDQGAVDVAVILKSYKAGREEQEKWEESRKEEEEEEGEAEEGGEKKKKSPKKKELFHVGEMDKVIEGLNPDCLYNVQLSIHENTKHNLVNVMEERRVEILKAKQERRDEEIMTEAVKAKEKAEQLTRKFSDIDASDLLGAQKLAKRVEEAGAKAMQVEMERMAEVIRTREEEEEPGLDDDEWTGLIKIKQMCGDLSESLRAGGSVGGEGGESIQVWTKRDKPDVVLGLALSYVWVMVYDKPGREEGKDWEVSGGGGGGGVAGLLSSQNKKVPRVLLRWGVPRDNGYPISAYLVQRRVLVAGAGGEEEGVEEIKLEEVEEEEKLTWTTVGKCKVPEFIDTIRDVVVDVEQKLVYRVCAVNKLGMGEFCAAGEVVVKRTGTKWETVGGAGELGVPREIKEVRRAADADRMMLSSGTISLVQPGMVVDWKKLQRAKKRKVQRK
ncbi:hypothetical protein TrLO_g5500 [Triparma laevis f. longispina]|nr:hypothetical protein TrLO_g5500 [Triparma laevis f. longispina]